MKKTVFLFIFLCYGFIAFAQDVIVMKSGDEIEAVIQEITVDNINYKRYSNPDGPTITVSKSDVFMIKYANGEKETFKTTELVIAVETAPAAFTFNQRLGTWVLNAFIPGLGSYVIMNDWVGGSVMLGGAILGGIFIGVGISNILTSETTEPIYSDWYGSSYISSYEIKVDEDKLTGGIAMTVIGSVILLADGIFNIFRSVTYNKPALKAAKEFDPRALNIAILPGEHGIEKVALSYTIQF